MPRRATIATSVATVRTVTTGVLRLWLSSTISVSTARAKIAGEMKAPHPSRTSLTSWRGGAWSEPTAIRATPSGHNELFHAWES